MTLPPVCSPIEWVGPTGYHIYTHTTGTGTLRFQKIESPHKSSLEDIIVASIAKK